MTPHPNPTDHLSRPTHPRLLIQGIGVLSVLAILSSGFALAQTPDSAVGDSPVESAPAPSSAPLSKPSVSVETTPALPGDFPAAAPIAPSGEVTSNTPSPNSSESYIDSTGYSIGATQRSSDLSVQTARVPSLPSTIQVGPVSVNSYGLSFGQTAPSLPSIKDYYFRTLRPPGRLGNGNIQLMFPLAIPAPITSLFGWRVHPVSGAQAFHSGTDLGAPMGTPVLAAYAGRVAIADFLGGYGLAVVLDHNKDTQQTLYGHLSEIFVKPGEWIKQGVVIGRVGSTGLSTGPHLHFEFRQLTPEGWVALDPGTQLEYALAQLMKSMGGVAQLPTNSNTAQTLQLDLSATLDVKLQDQS